LKKEIKPVLFIVNPQADNGRCAKRFRQLSRVIEGKYPFEVFFTAQRGDAEKEAGRAVQKGMTRIFVAGGDGTVNEVINGIGKADVEIGIIPFGTGNDLAKAIQLSRKPKAIEKMVLHQERLKVKAINVGQINNRHFAIAAGIGFDGLVAKKANESRVLKKLGALGYLFSVFSVIRAFQPMTIDVQADDASYQLKNGWLLAIGNGPFYGGGMKICPTAKVDDDQFDLCMVHSLTKWQLLRFLPKVYSGSHIHLKNYVHLLRAKKIAVDCHSLAVSHADGELIDATHLTITLCDYKIRLLTPE